MATCISHVLLPFLVTCFLSAVCACPRKCDCRYFDNGTVVHCRFQSMDSVPLDFPDDTTEIDFGYNNISEISIFTFQRLPVLRKLVLDNCNIRTLGDSAFASLPALKELFLRENSISDVHHLSFQGIPQLSVLDLENNKLGMLPDSLFEDLTLKELVIRGNDLERLPSGLFDRTQVEILDLGYNRFQTISTEVLNSLSDRLKVLRIIDNEQLLTLPQDIFSGFSFDELTLYGSKIKDPSFLRHVSAVKLDIGGNNFGNLDLSPYSNLRTTEEIHLHNSGIAALDTPVLANLNNLKYLDISRNKLTSIDGEIFMNLPQLTKLDLTSNQLKMLPPNFGQYLPNLAELVLLKNTLETLNPESFSGINNLTSLDLQYNLIQIIPESMGPVFDRIKYLHLEGNPLHCNCEMRWFRTWLEKFRLFTGAEHCYSPRYEYIWNILPADFTCDKPEIYFITSNSSVLKGTDQMLTCVARGDPAPEMEWVSPDGRSLTHIGPSSNRTVYKTFVSMKIQDMQDYQSGMYICVAYSLVANTSAAVKLSVMDELPVATVLPTTTEATTLEITTESQTTITTTTTTPVPTTVEQSTIEQESHNQTTDMIKQTTTSGVNISTNDSSASADDDGPLPVPVDHRGVNISGPFVAVIIIVLIACIVIVIVLVVLGVMMRQRKFVREYDVSSGKLKILDSTDMDSSKEPLDLNDTQPEEKRPIGVSSV